MLDKVIINKLECFGKHGVFKEENVLGQKFVVSAFILRMMAVISQICLFLGQKMMIWLQV